MKSITSLFFLSLSVPAVLGQNGGGGSNPFTQLLNTLITPFIDSVCTATQTQLGLVDTLDCTCDATYLGLFRGIDASILCTLPESRCLLPNNLFCVDGDINVNAKGGIFTQTQVESDIGGCFVVESGLPAGIGNIEDLCLKFIPDGLSLSTCTASIGDTQCTSCTICDSGIDFTFDCSNINISGTTFFNLPGPNVDTCIGLSLLPSA